MAYSKITEVEIANFMSLEHVKLVFDESGIINLKGYNNSGKSSCMRAIAVCLMDMWQSKQAKFIKEGKDFFRVKVSFDDGVSILRDKYINGQSLYELHKDGKIVFTTKEGKALTRVNGVPQVIKDYLALCPIESGYLNYQSCKDPLLLIDTTGSTNYNNFHEVLKIVQISRASALLNSDRNEVCSEVASIEAKIQEKELQLVESEGITEELIEVMSAREQQALNLESQSVLATKLEETLTGLDRLKPIPELNTIDVSRTASIGKLFEAANTLGTLPQVPEIPRVDDTQLRSVKSLEEHILQLNKLHEASIPNINTVDVAQLKSIGFLNETLKHLGRVYSQSIPDLVKVNTEQLTLVETLLETADKLEEVSVIPVISKVDLEGMKKLSALSSITSSFKDLSRVDTAVKEYDSTLDTLKEEISSLVSEAGKLGLAFAKCSNCGTYMQVDLSKGGES